MAISDMMRQGWRRMPDRTAITFMNQTSPGVYSSTSTPNCWRRGRGAKEAENSAGVYVIQRADWFIPKAMLATQPLPGDIVRLPTITNAASPYYSLAGDYIILTDGVDEAGALGAWKCSTGYPFLQSGLTDTITIYEPITAPGDGGRAVEVDRIIVASGIAAKIQPRKGLTAQETIGKVQIPQTFDCYLSSAVSVQAHYYVIDQNGVQYSVNAENSDDMLGVLQSVELETLL